MAIYRFEAKVIGRSSRKGGRSVVAAAAYRSGSNLYDEKYEVRHDYSRRQSGIVHTEILAPSHAPNWVTSREALWNSVEQKEDESNRRASAQLAREFIPALPAELNHEQRLELVTQFVKSELVSRGMIADIAIHESNDSRNPHAHILCSMRTIDPDGFGAKERDWNDKSTLIHWRKAWEEHCNEALEKANIDDRVDCRSLADQGIDRAPQPKIGVSAAAMERKGELTNKGLMHHWHSFGERIRSSVRGIRTEGEVHQVGTGETWWERAQSALAPTFESARNFLRDESSGWVYKETTRRNHDMEPPDVDRRF